MLTQHHYDELKPENWKPRVEKCCEQETPDDPRGCDCCYDDWQKELQDVNTKYSAAEESAKQLGSKLLVITDRRDKLKNWYDELTIANDLARKLCDQLEILWTQTEKIASNTKLTVKAIRYLYCMIRDFYMQVDLIKTKYDRLMNCIKCLNNPALAPGQGILKCLEEYGKKLDALIATRDQLLQAMIVIIKLACRINKNLEEEYGLMTVITEWKMTLKCDVLCKDDDEPCDDDDDEEEEHETEDASPESKAGKCLGDCKQVPIIRFPICKDPYYKYLNEQYKNDKAKAEDLAKDLLEENKKKEALLACKQSLVAAIKEVDPKLLCK